MIVIWATLLRCSTAQYVPCAISPAPLVSRAVLCAWGPRFVPLSGAEGRPVYLLCAHAGAYILGLGRPAEGLLITCPLTRGWDYGLQSTIHVARYTAGPAPAWGLGFRLSRLPLQQYRQPELFYPHHSELAGHVAHGSPDPQLQGRSLGSFS